MRTVAPITESLRFPLSYATSRVVLYFYVFLCSGLQRPPVWSSASPTVVWSVYIVHRNFFQDHRHSKHARTVPDVYFFASDRIFDLLYRHLLFLSFSFFSFTRTFATARYSLSLIHFPVPFIRKQQLLFCYLICPMTVFR